MRNWKYVAPAVVFLVAPLSAEASTSGADGPWVQPLQTIADALSGPTARAVIAIAVVAAAFGLAFADTGFVRRALGVVMAGALVAAITSWFIPLVGLDSGALF